MIKISMMRLENDSTSIKYYVNNMHLYVYICIEIVLFLINKNTYKYVE